MIQKLFDGLIALSVGKRGAVILAGSFLAGMVYNWLQSLFQFKRALFETIFQFNSLSCLAIATAMGLTFFIKNERISGIIHISLLMLISIATQVTEPQQYSPFVFLCITIAYIWANGYFRKYGYKLAFILFIVVLATSVCGGVLSDKSIWVWLQLIFVEIFGYVAIFAMLFQNVDPSFRTEPEDIPYVFISKNHGVTPAQHQVLYLVFQCGSSTKEAASQLGISPKTASNHIRDAWLRIGNGLKEKSDLSGFIGDRLIVWSEEEAIRMSEIFKRHRRHMER